MRNILCLVLAILAACSDAGVTPNGGDDPFADPVFITAVADVAGCDSQGDEATAAIVDTLPGVILMAGDIAYESGTAQQFADCYHPSWGRHRDRTRPAPGNHEYETANAAPYYEYFGELAGPAGRGYYSFNVGDWHIISLNSNIDMKAGSPQEQWLRQDLATNAAECTIAFWHHPLFTSGFHNANPAVAPLWKALEEAGAEIVIAGHDHHYESFAPQNSLGAADTKGIRQFIVGNGGRSLFPALFSVPNSQKRYDTGYGVLRLKLGDGAYEWQFIPVKPGDFSDSGRGECH
jgi:hypothetical protein